MFRSFFLIEVLALVWGIFIKGPLFPEKPRKREIRWRRARTRRAVLAVLAIAGCVVLVWTWTGVLDVPSPDPDVEVYVVDGEATLHGSGSVVFTGERANVSEWEGEYKCVVVADHGIHGNRSVEISGGLEGGEESVKIEYYIMGHLLSAILLVLVVSGFVSVSVVAVVGRAAGREVSWKHPMASTMYFMFALFMITVFWIGGEAISLGEYRRWPPPEWVGRLLSVSVAGMIECMVVEVVAGLVAMMWPVEREEAAKRGRGNGSPAP